MCIAHTRPQTELLIPFISIHSGRHRLKQRDVHGVREGDHLEETWDEGHTLQESLQVSN